MSAWGSFRAEKPPHGTPIDLSGPLARGLALCVGDGSGGNPLDAATMTLGSFRGGASWTAGQTSSAIGLTSGTALATIASPWAAQWPASFAARLVYRGQALPNQVPVVSLIQSSAVPSTSASGIIGFQTVSTGEMALFCTQAGAYTRGVNIAIPAGVSTLSATITTAGYSCYVDGVLVASATAAYGQPPVGTRYFVGGDWYSGSRLTGLSVEAAFGWSRVLSAEEHRMIALAPWLSIYGPRKKPYVSAFACVVLLAYSLTGPSGGVQGIPSTPFSVTPNQASTDTITLSDGGAGGTFTPASLTFTGSSAPQTFTYTPSIAGTIEISAVSAGSHVVHGSPLAYTSTSSSQLVIPRALKGAILAPITIPSPWTFDPERTQPMG